MLISAWHTRKVAVTCFTPTPLALGSCRITIRPHSNAYLHLLARASCRITIRAHFNAYIRLLTVLCAILSCVLMPHLKGLKCLSLQCPLTRRLRSLTLRRRLCNLILSRHRSRRTGARIVSAGLQCSVPESLLSSSASVGRRCSKRPTAHGFQSVPTVRADSSGVDLRH
jgi:hypothetical protein